MTKKVTVDGIEVELDDDINVEDLDNHPSPDNALSDEEMAEIEHSEDILGE